MLLVSLSEHFPQVKNIYIRKLSFIGEDANIVIVTAIFLVLILVVNEKVKKKKTNSMTIKPTSQL